MQFHDFMLRTMMFQMMMMLFAMPFGLILGWWWDRMSKAMRAAVLAIGAPLFVWPMLTQWAGMYIGHAPHWFVSIFS